MPFSPKQQEYFNNATHRWNVKTGATRSGKTFMDYFVIPKRILNTKGRGLIVILGHTQQTLQRNIIDPMQRIWGTSLVGNISNRTGAANIFGKKCYVLGADNKARINPIRGSSIEYCYGDEVATWEEGVFQMLKSRLDQPDSTFDGTCNPETPMHWFKAFLDSDADIYQQSYTIYDNPFLDPDLVHNLEKEYAGTVFFQRFILGEWTLAEGLIYKHFSEEKNLYSQPLLQEVRKRCVSYVTIDYGSANPSAFLHILYDPVERMVYVDKEYYYDGRHEVVQKTDADYAEDLLAFMPPEQVQTVVIDPSALSFRIAVRRLNYRVKEADNDVLDGIRDVSTLLSIGRLKVNAACENLLKEIRTYAWDEKAAQQLGIDKPIKQNDHAVDALRYFVHTIVRMRQMLTGRIS